MMMMTMTMTIVEGKEEQISQKSSLNDSSSIEEAEEEMVCKAVDGDDNDNTIPSLLDTSDIQDKGKDEDDDDEYNDDDGYDDGYDDDDDVVVVDDECRNEDDDCEFWATLEPSECKTNPGFMLSNCKMACRSCERQ